MNPNDTQLDDRVAAIESHVMKQPHPYPRGQTPVIAHIDDFGYVPGSDKDPQQLGQIPTAFTPAAEEVQVERTDVTELDYGNQAPIRTEELVVDVDRGIDDIGLPPESIEEGMEAFNAAQAGALPQMANLPKIFALGHELAKSGLTPGSRNFKRVLAKRMKKLDMPVHAKKAKKKKR